MRAMLLFSMLALVPGWAPSRVDDSEPCDKHQKPFRVSAAGLRDAVHTIALTPAWLQAEVSESTRQRTQVIDSLVAVTLEAGGFGLVPTAVTDSLWKTIRDSTGGLFDPATGRPDSARTEAARSQFLRSLHDQFQADAILYSAVLVVPARFDDGSAKWDGAKQSFANFGKRFLRALLSGGTYQGQTNALSLRTALVGADGQLLYDNRGGLQVLAIPRSGKFIEVPESALLTDRGQVRGAVRIAMCQLVTKR